MTDPYLPELSDMTEEEAVELMELLEQTNPAVGQALANIASQAVPLGPEILAAQLATAVAHLEHTIGFEKFDKLLRMTRAGYKASFRMGIRMHTQPKA